MYFKNILWVVLFIYISNIIPFPGIISENPLYHPPSPFMRVFSQPTTYSCLTALHSPLLGHQAFMGLRASPLIDARQGHHLLHMQLEPWVPPCVLFGWWFSPWELWGYWLVHIVVPPMRLQTPSVPWVLFLVSPLGTLCTVQWFS